MQVSDFIVNFLKSQKIRHVFLITGGAVAFLVDKIGLHRGIDYVCMQHEQAAAMAADAYSRVGPGLGVAMATSGPGATNLITGICCSYFDSIPTLFITGQVNTHEQKKGSKIRQLGFQETDIVDIVRPIVKFCSKLEKAEDIKYLLEKAVYIAKSGRPGPVLLDIPVNLQYAVIDKKRLRSFNASFSKSDNRKDVGIKFQSKINQVIKLIEKSQRPVILVGFGIRIAGAEEEIKALAKFFKFPIVSTWSAIDLFPSDSPFLVGQSGVYGSRFANFTIQNSDLLLAIGARLDTRQTGNPQTYARDAKKIIVDIDYPELYKRKALQPDVDVNFDAKQFLRAVLEASDNINIPNVDGWWQKITRWKERYPLLREEYFLQSRYVNPYVFMKLLSDFLPEDAIIIPDEGGNLAWTIQGIRIKSKQRLFSAFGNSPMGYALPASIGASIATGKKRPIVCITGDGGLQLNIQEFQTIVHQNLPIKMFILNNRSYGIIKQFQDTWLGSRYEASEKGYSVPDFIKLAKAYGLKTVQIKSQKEIEVKLRKILSLNTAVFCDVLLDPDQKIIPKLDFGRPLEDLSPLLPREEFFENMIVEPLTMNSDNRA